MSASNHKTRIAGQVELSADGKMLTLSGRIDFNNASRVYRDLQQLLTESVEEIDCQGIEHADSTALALLLVAAGEARGNQQALRISGINKRLESLAEVYGVGDLLISDTNT